VKTNSYYIRWRALSGDGDKGRTHAVHTKREARVIASALNEEYAGRYRHEVRYAKIKEQAYGGLYYGGQ
jgi:hypothetical protein